MTHFEAKGRQRKGLSGTFGESTRPPWSHSPGPGQGKLRFEEELRTIRRRGSRELMPAIDNSMSAGNPKLHSLARERTSRAIFPPSGGLSLREEFNERVVAPLWGARSGGAPCPCTERTRSQGGSPKGGTSPNPILPNWVILVYLPTFSPVRKSPWGGVLSFSVSRRVKRPSPWILLVKVWQRLSLGFPCAPNRG
jgi:hypothetical protein